MIKLVDEGIIHVKLYTQKVIEEYLEQIQQIMTQLHTLLILLKCQSLEVTASAA